MNARRGFTRDRDARKIQDSISPKRKSLIHQSKRELGIVSKDTDKEIKDLPGVERGGCLSESPPEKNQENSHVGTAFFKSGSRTELIPESTILPETTPSTSPVVG